MPLRSLSSNQNANWTFLMNSIEYDFFFFFCRDIYIYVIFPNIFHTQVFDEIID